MAGADRDLSKTAVLGRHDLEELATRSVRTPTEPPPLATVRPPGLLARNEGVVPVAVDDRKTERMRAKHFHQLVTSGEAPITPELLESIDWHADSDASSSADMAIPRDPETVLDELAALGAPTAADLAAALPALARTAPIRRPASPGRALERAMLATSGVLLAIALALAAMWFAA